MPRAKLFLFALVAVAFGLRLAAAEGNDPRVRAVVDAIEPAADGVSLTIRNAAPAPPELTVRNVSGKPLELIGYDFEPFVRIGPDGVFANRRSRTYYVTQDPTGTAAAPKDARAGAPPAWVRLGPGDGWRWFEGRAVWKQPIPQAIATGDQQATLGTWSLPAKLGGSAITFKGHTIFRPILGELRARLVRVEPAVEGLTVNVLQGPVPGLIAQNGSGQTVEITGRDGLPFARLSSAGVDVNLDSATARDNPRFGSTGASGWVHVQDTQVLSWLERRAVYENEDPPGDPRQPAELVRWEVPFTLGGSSKATIRGVTEWQPLVSSATPPERSGSSAFALAAAAVVILVFAATAIAGFRRRRRA